MIHIFRLHQHLYIYQLYQRAIYVYVLQALEMQLPGPAVAIGH